MEKDVAGALYAIDEIYKEGVDFNTLSSQILNHFRDLLLVKTLKDPKKIIYTSHLSEFQEMAGETDLEDLLIIIDILKNLAVEIKYADNKRVVFEMNAIKICKRLVKDDMSLRLKALEDKLSGLENKGLPNNFKHEEVLPVNNKLNIERNLDKATDKKEVPKNSDHDILRDGPEDGSIEKSNQSAIIEDNSEVNQVGEVTLSLEKINSDWQKILAELKSKSYTGFGGFLTFAKLEKFHDNILEVVFQEGYEFYYNYCSEPERKNILPDLLKSIYGKDIDVRFKLQKAGADKLEEIFGKNNIEDI